LLNDLINIVEVIIIISSNKFDISLVLYSWLFIYKFWSYI